MLNIELLTSGKFTTNGSSVLKMMQNNSTPTLDLIVREAVQNSLDASLITNVKNNIPVIVDFEYDTFDSKLLCSQFEEIGEKLKQKGNGNNNYLAIRDFNTVGLTGYLDGSFKPGEKNQNLGKLVFHVMKPQDQEGAGGSWGIGKTVYYRLGIGLVIYYSRIKKDNGEFEERLAAVLVENEENKNGILSSFANNSGVAFFGKQKNNITSIQATTDHDQIERIISCFKIFPYDKEETGTTIIIPFIDENKILMSNRTNEDNVWWQSSIQKYIELALLRWYFPRMTKSYPYGPRLFAMVNNNAVKKDDINSPVFSKLSDLYEACYSDEYPSWITKQEISRNSNLEENEIGYFCYGKVTVDELKIVSRHLPDPYLYTMLEHEENSKNLPLIAYTRKPGMIVNYQTNNSVKTNSDEYILGVFSLNSKNYILRPKRINLDEYIRQCEKSDHTNWVDHEIMENTNKVRIVTAIEKEIKNKLEETYGEAKPTTGEANINTNFAKKFGKLLLPDEAFGKSGSSRTAPKNGGRGGGGKTVTKKKNIINFVERKFEKGSIITEYGIEIKNPIRSLTIKNMVSTINGGIEPQQYIDEGLSYPCNVENVMVKINTINNKPAKEHPKMLNLNSVNTISGYEMKALFTSEDSIFGLEIEKDKSEFVPISFTLRIMLNTKDTLIQTFFDFKMEDEV